MKILYVAVEAIYPTNTGSRIRAFQIVKALAQKYKVGLAYISDESMPNVDDLEFEYINQIDIGKPLSQLSSLQKLSLLLRGICKGSFSLSEFYLGEKQVGSILEVIKASQPGIVVLQSSYILPLAKKLKQKYPHIKIIVDAHNIESLLQNRMADTASSALMRPIKKYAANNLAKMEMQAGKSISAIASVSDEEAAWFKKYNPSIIVEVVPNGVDVDFFTKTKKHTEKPVIAFCGSMSYLPNHEGAMWFFDNVWSIIKKAIPDAEWLIIGKDPPENVRNLANYPGITVTGTVDDVRGWIEKSRVSVVPLLSGGGTRLKILEAMSMEQVVVSTSLGAEGIANSDGIIRVDEPNAMAQKIIELLQSTSIERLGKFNRSLAIKKYSWKAIGQSMVKLIESTKEQAKSKRLDV